MGLNPPAAVLFDLDGTLVDSEERNAVVWRRFFEHHGVPFTEERRRQVSGRRGTDALAELAAELPVEFRGASAGELLRTVLEIELVVPGLAPPVPGAQALVRRLAGAGTSLALVTSAMREAALRRLDDLGVTPEFGVVVTAEDVRVGKPDPEGYLRACRSLGVDPADAIGVEDSVAGVAAVLGAGMRCIAVATTQPRSALSAADVVVDDLTDLQTLGGLLWPADRTREGTPVVERRVRLPEGVGLHARPAAMFVRAATAAPVEVTLGRAGGEPVSARSVLAVMGLGVGGGEEIVLRADGDGAGQVLDDLAGVLTARDHA